MRKNVFGRKLKRDTKERKALFKSLVTSLVLQERIQTTESKAKAVRGHIEKLVTKARVGGINAKRLIQPYMHKEALDKMLDSIAPRFVDRPGGYTRIVKLGNRFADNAPVVILEWVVQGTVQGAKVKDDKKESKAKKTEKGQTKKTEIAKASIKGKEKKTVKKEQKSVKNGQSSRRKTAKKEIK